jgi:hypothetical protein
MKRYWKIAVLSGVLCAGVLMVSKAQLGNILKAGGIAVLVDRFGPDINKFINQITGQKNAGTSAATKVVPILSIGDGGYIGAVQVAGPEDLVDKVQAVAQIEGRFKAIGGIRVRGLVPVSTKTPHKGINRVDGVGVSAIIDFKI